MHLMVPQVFKICYLFNNIVVYHNIIEQVTDFKHVGYRII